MSVDGTHYQNILKALDTAIRTTDAPWALNRPRAIARTRSAAIDAITPILAKAITDAETAGHLTGRAARDTDLIAQANTGFDAGFEAGYATGREVGARAGRAEGRADAIAEAATLLKRHGHRTAVDRVQALATPTVDTDTGQAPTDAPRPTPGPQNGTSAPGVPADNGLMRRA